MKTLGIDYGEKHIGLAFAEDSQAQGIAEVYTNEAVERIQQLVKKITVERIVIGLPPGRLVPQIKAFAQKLGTFWHGQILFVDETLSSRFAQQTLVRSGKSRKRRKAQEHRQAAALLLQDFLDQEGKN